MKAKPASGTALWRDEAGEQAAGEIALAGQRKVEPTAAAALEGGDRVWLRDKPEQRVVVAVENLHAPLAPRAGMFAEAPARPIRPYRPALSCWRAARRFWPSSARQLRTIGAQ